MLTLKAPDFWQKKTGIGTALKPLGMLYGWIVSCRSYFSVAEKMSIPVICVGNLVMGGAGKTPLVMALVGFLKELGFHPHIISRGYGGTVSGPLMVDPAIHQAADVGDEPLLLAKNAITWVGRDRVAAARAAIQSRATILIMDDGLQNPALVKDISLMVVDGTYGFGNERIFPAGPLRESAVAGFSRTDALIEVGQPCKNLSPSMAKLCNEKQRFTVSVTSVASGITGPVIGFAGLGIPEKFRQTLLEAGVDLKAFIPFPDHHPYTAEELTTLQNLAIEKKATLVTTSKDHVRLDPAWQHQIQPWPITMVMPDVLKQWVQLQLVTKGFMDGPQGKNE